MSVNHPRCRVALRAGFGLFLGGMVASTAVPACAQALSFPGNGAVSRALLPYMPWLFDFVVQGSRNFAEITYDRRGYDAVTGSFFVTGLHVRRDAADVTIGRLRTDLASIMLEDIAVDTRGFEPMLPPPLREGLRRLGRDRIEGNALISVRSNGARSAYDIAMRYDLSGIGVVAATATVDGFHVLVPLSDFEGGQLSREPQVTGSLVKASLAYEDHGLMAAAIAVSAGDAGITADQLKAGLLAVPSQIAAELIGGLPGGASPALKDRVYAWATEAETFLRNEDAIRVTFAPAEPVPLQRFQSGVIDETLVAALNPGVTRGFAERAPPAAEAGSLAQAGALISGAGAPQDREAGARSLLALAASGDLGAVRALAQAFGDAPAPDLAPGELASLYGYLLVARALDGGVGDQALAALTASLPPDTVLAAEHQAALYFQVHSPGHGRIDIRPDTMADYDADALRAAAYDFYEGHDVPRDFTRALALALVASAAGDPFAASLRDDLTAAASSKTIVLSEATARNEAARLWAGYRTTHPGGAEAPK